MILEFEILGEPFSKQSFRFARRGNYIHKYQPKKIVNKENGVAWQIINQLPKGFVPTTEAVALVITYIFPPLKSWSKKKLVQLEAGEKMYKTTKPDLQDNLCKGVCDAMEGIVFINDSQICSLRSEKVYGLTPKTLIELHIQSGS
ncbi:MAG TPA: RusA family crossover junction endodeoxyribonuclease [Flavobacteriales bacterium]|nr:RusA family crossover junction endodeoxyribonuclease [Flavobacteriales bacterium]